MSYCGRFPVSRAGGVGVRVADGVAGFAGVQRCGSVWCCPVCNSKVMTRRAVELGAAVETWTSVPGRSTLFMTFTLRHTRTDSLETLWAAISKAWRRIVSGKGWKGDKVRHGVVGYVRVVEVTESPRNGWHVHVHALLFVEGDAKPRDLLRSMFTRWRAAAESAGLRAPLLRGQDVRVVTSTAGQQHLAAYLTKAQYSGRIGFELTASQGKTARSKLGTRTVWQLLTDARDGLDREVGLWAEWERVSKGKRQMTWSRGIRELLRLGVEVEDEEIAAEELGTEADTVAVITAEGWQRLVELRLLAECLRAFERGEGTGFLREMGIGYEMAEVA